MKGSKFVRPDPSSKERPSRFSTLATRTIALAFALAFVVAACDVYAQVNGSGESGGDLTLDVASPGDRAEVSMSGNARDATSTDLVTTPSIGGD